MTQTPAPSLLLYIKPTPRAPILYVSAYTICVCVPYMCVLVPKRWQITFFDPRISCSFVGCRLF